MKLSSFNQRNALAALIVAIAFLLAPPNAWSAQSIVALVNDQPISAFDLRQRINLVLSNSRTVQKKMSLRLKSGNINAEFKKFALAHKPRSREEVKRLQKKFVGKIRREIMKSLRPKAREIAMNELVEEAIKLQEAKRLNIVVSDDQVSNAIKNMAKLNKMTDKQFARLMKQNGVDLATMRQRLKASIGWRKAVQKKYGRQMSLTNQYINRELSAGGRSTDEQKNIELQLHRITLTVPGKINQKIMIKRLVEADQLRSRFTSCQTVQSLTLNVKNAKYENLGRKRASSFPVLTRTQLLQAKIGQMPPPILSSEGVQLYAVCGRRKIAAGEKKRKVEKQKLQTQEYNILAERHLRDLKQDAYIEYR